MYLYSAFWETKCVLLNGYSIKTISRFLICGPGFGGEICEYPPVPNIFPQIIPYPVFCFFFHICNKSCMKTENVLKFLHVRSWSRNCPHCITICVMDVRSLSRLLWITELTKRALGSGPPDTDTRIRSKPGRVPYI